MITKRIEFPGGNVSSNPIIPLGSAWNGPDEDGEYTRWFLPYAALAAKHREWQLAHASSLRALDNFERADHAW